MNTGSRDLRTENLTACVALAQPFYDRNATRVCNAIHTKVIEFAMLYTQKMFFTPDHVISHDPLAS